MIGGASWVLTLSMFNVTVQLSTPRWVVGRAMSLYQMATFGGMALGSWIWGLVAEGYGPGEALLASAALMLVGAALGLWIKLPEHAALNLDPLNRWREPQPGAGSEAALGADRHLDRIHHPRGEPARFPRCDGGAAADQAARRRPPLDAEARPGKS